MEEGEAATPCHEKAILNNLYGTRKVTLCNKWSHHWQQFFSTSVKEENVFLKPVSSLARDWLVKVGFIAVALQNVKVKTMGRESERLLLLSQSVCNADDNGVRRRKKNLKFDSAY